MAAVEKLFKAFEALKTNQNHGQTASEDTSAKKKEQLLGKKEKIAHCNTITDSICSPLLRSIQDFPKFLGIALETFLFCCDDPNADVRMIADESLNRTIKTLLDSGLSRIQVELYKEIKKNGPSRSLRAALWRFADLCHLIRPQKCRPYISNLLSCLVQIARRPEESVQETLATATCKICGVLGKFTMDGEVKVLLRAFFPNLKSTSAVARRTAATCLTTICQHSRKPHHFFVWLLNTLIDAVVPVNQNCALPVVLGVLLCFRNMIPHLTSPPSPDSVLQGSFGSFNKEQEHCVSLDHLIQVYELLLYYLQHPDHNVVTSSLETLQQLLRTPPSLLVPVLMSSKGIHRTHIFTVDRDVFPMTRGGSEFGSIPSLIGDDSNLYDDLESSYNDVQNVSNMNDGRPPEIAESELNSMVYQDELADSMSYASVDDIEERTSTYSNIKIGHCVDEKLGIVGHTGTLGRSFHKRECIQIDKFDAQSIGNHEISQKSSQSPSPAACDSVTFQMGDLGSFVDKDIPLVYCMRLLSSSFLLTGSKGGLMPERNARVSVKSLALGCMSGVVHLYPRAFCLPLFKDSAASNDNDDVQCIADVLLFAQHSDPQLRGSTALLVGNFISAALCESMGNFGAWLPKSVVTINQLVSLLLVLLADEASITCRLALLALKSCVGQILNSIHGPLGLHMLNALLKLAQNSYWLVKSELLDLLPEISYVSVNYLEGIVVPSEQQQLQSHANNFQNFVMDRVLLVLLGDEDYRVRQAAASAFVRIIPQLFYPGDHPQQDPIIALGRIKTAAYLEPLLHETSSPPPHPVHGLVLPNSVCNAKASAPALKSTLSRIINILVTTVSGSTSKQLTLGCLHTLFLLSEEYPVTLYSNSWLCSSTGHSPPARGLMRSNSVKQPPPASINKLPQDNPNSERGGLLPFVISLLTTTSYSMDLGAHQQCMQLASNLFAGAVLNCLHPPTPNVATSESTTDAAEPWSFLKDAHVASMAHNLLTHLLRVLNICAHIIEDQSPIPLQAKTSLPSLPNAPSLSPIKRKSKVATDSSTASLSARNSPGKVDKEEKAGSKVGQSSSGGSTAPHIGPSTLNAGSISSHLGTFYHLPHYMKLYEVVRSAYSNYRVSLDLHNSEKFTRLLHAALNSLAQMLEVATLTEMGPRAEELLRYFRTVVNMESTAAILCVQQLLKALFSTNLATQWENASQEEASCKPGHAARLVTSASPGLYHFCFSAPCAQLTQMVNGVGPRPATVAAEAKDSANWMGWIKKKWERKLPSIGKSSGKGDKSNLASYIRLFESLVIRALKLYTTTSSVDLQCQVLQLLAQLVQLRVNYCLLDSEQIFIGFIIKQFEYIEGGQVQFTEKLIPHIFHFLVLLSYERYHSKSIIGVPKIIQLCDGVMASGQPPTTHTIPSLLPIVEDLFLVRGTIYKSDAGKELDIQREVLVSMLFRFVHYYQVLEIFILILQANRKESEERWKKLSRQIIDTLLPFLANQQVNLDNRIAMDVLHRLFEAVAPFVFRPVDVLLRTLLAPPHQMGTLSSLQRWISLVLAVLRVLIAQSKEEVVLGRLAELSLSVNVFVDTLDLHKRKASDPSVVLHPIPNDAAQSPNDPVTPEEILARFLLQVIGLISTELKNLSFSPTTAKNSTKFLCEQLAHLLLYLTHMFQSGHFRRVANVCMTMIKTDQEADSRYFGISQINTTILDLAILHPTLTLQWCNVLILLNFDSQPFWSRILRTPMNGRFSFPQRSESANHVESEHSTCSNMELVHKGGLILFCDYICENLSDAEHMTWLIVNHISELVELYSEPPINDLICNVQRNTAASGLFIQAVNTRCENLNRPSLVRKMLACLEAIHSSQSGALLILLVERFLPTPHLAIARTSASMACRRVEMLLAETAGEGGGGTQLTPDDLDRLLELIQSHGIAKKHTRLVMLLWKLRDHWFPNAGWSKCSTAENSEEDPTRIATQTMDKIAFVKLVKQCCREAESRRHCIQLLSVLEYNDLLAVMVSKEFNLLLLEDSLAYGADLFLNQAKDGSQSEQESPLSPLPHTTGGLALYSAAKQTLLQQVAHLLTLLPSPSQTYNPSTAPLSPREAKYALRLNDLFGDVLFWDTLQQVTPVVGQYLHLLRKHSVFADIPLESMGDLCRFAILVLEALHWLMTKKAAISPLFLQSALDTVKLTFFDCNLATILSQKEFLSLACTAIHSIHCIFSKVHHQSPKANQAVPQNLNWTSADNEVQHVMRACAKMADIISWMEQQRNATHHQVPEFLSDSLNSIIIGLARLPLVNSFVRTPPLAWQLGWTPEGVKNLLTTPIPPLPVNLLQEQDVLWQYIFRVNLLGWTSRQQFEETWMALLGVLSAIPSGESDEVDKVHTACLAIKCLTSLLLQTLLLPQPGNPCNSRYLWQSCEKPVAYLHTRHGKKFPRVWNLVEERRHNLTGTNATRSNNPEDHCHLPCVTTNNQLRTRNYSAGQVSLDYLQVVVGSHSDTLARGPLSYDEREKSLSSSGLDLHSCLHFLLDLYSQWLEPTTAASVQLALLTESVRSVVMLSDIFTEKAQYEWMLDTLLEMLRLHPTEDEIMAQYLGIGICKAIAVLGMDSDLAESARKVMEQSLKSTYLSTRIMALHGVLYLLELGPNELTQPILPSLCEYLLQHLQSSQLPNSHSEDHTLIMWTVTFYLIENLKENLDGEFCNHVMKITLEALLSTDISPLVQLSVTFGLERLVLTNVIAGKNAEPVIKLAVARFCQVNPTVSLPSLGLLLSCIYAGKDNETWKLEEMAIAGSSPQLLPADTESLFAAMENVTILFNRMKRGYPCEAETIARVLPHLLADHFPLNEIMNKIIGEFISNQQPHPHLLATIVFRVFEWAHTQGKGPMVQEWVLLSLSNFTQQSPISMAIWSLTCFFISASTNPWLRAVFPYVQQRMGKLSAQDVNLFCLTGLDFYKQVLNESERRAFHSAISSVAQSGNPYYALLEQL